MKDNKYSSIAEELEWLEEQASYIKQDVEANPYNEIRDRVISLVDSRGNSSEKVTATEEQQKKSIRESLKEYAQLLEVIDKLREKEEAKVRIRGDVDISPHAKKFLNGKN